MEDGILLPKESEPIRIIEKEIQGSASGLYGMIIFGS